MPDDMSLILRELGEIKATQTHIQSDIAEIKQDNKELRTELEKSNFRISECERHQSEEDGKRKAFTAMISVCVALIASTISTFLTWINGGGH